MTNKDYEELVPNRIFIGGVDAIDDLLANEKIDVIYDLHAEVKGPLQVKSVSISQLLMMPNTKINRYKLLFLKSSMLINPEKMSTSIVIRDGDELVLLQQQLCWSSV